MTSYINCGYKKIDPVVLHCSTSNEPYCWERFTVSSESKVVDFVQDAAKHGLAGGLSIGINDHYGHTGIFSLATDRIIISESVEYCTASLYLTALQPYIHEAIARNSSNKLDQPNKPMLTPRELDCLLWSAEGKTASEIAQILSIKSATVVFHLKT